MLRSCGLQHWMVSWRDLHVPLDNSVTKGIAWPLVLFTLSPIESNWHNITSGFRQEVDESCALLGIYAACGGNFLPTFRDNLSGPIFKGQESQKSAVLRHSIKVILVECQSKQNTTLSQNFSNCKLNQWFAYKYKFCNELNTCNLINKYTFCT